MVDGLREPLQAELLLLGLRYAVDGLRDAELLLVLRFAVDGLGLEDAALRLPACAPVPARFEAVAVDRPRAWLLVTRLDPELAPYFCATLELL